MNDKDLRVIKTKKALTSSLYALLEIEPSLLLQFIKFVKMLVFIVLHFINTFMINMNYSSIYLKSLGKITLQLILRNVLIVRFKFCLIH